MLLTDGILDWSHADPRLLTPPDLITEHLMIHHLLFVTDPGADRDYFLFRHELLRVAANVRSGFMHSWHTTKNQREHPSPVSLTDLRIIEPCYARALMIYERWCYVRRQRDVQTIDLLFHALIQKMPVEPEKKYGAKTPWAGSTPGRYLWEYQHHNFAISVEMVS